MILMKPNNQDFSENLTLNESSSHIDKILLNFQDELHPLFTEVNLKYIVNKFNIALDRIFCEEVCDIICDDMGELEMNNIYRLSSIVWSCLKDFSVKTFSLFTDFSWNIEYIGFIILNMRCCVLKKLCELSFQESRYCAFLFSLVNQEELQHIYLDSVEYLSNKVSIEFGDDCIKNVFADSSEDLQLYYLLEDLIYKENLIDILNDNLLRNTNQTDSFGEDESFDLFDIWQKYIFSCKKTSSDNITLENGYTIDYNKIAPEIRKGIKHIINHWEYWKSIDMDFEVFDPDEAGCFEDGISQLIFDTQDRENVICCMHNLYNEFLDRFGYSLQKAIFVRDKLVKLIYIKNLDSSYVRTLLKQLDHISCCISDFPHYPEVLTQSLYAIALLGNRKDIDFNLKRDICYTLSLYEEGFALLNDGHNFFDNLDYYGFLEEEEEYIPEEYNFLSTESRRNIIWDQYYDHRN